MKVFGMISTASSERYTAQALESLFRTTAISDSDRVIVIDNDGGWSGPLPAQVELRRNDAPRGFAANMNVIIAEALSSSADAYLLNNDLIFTRGWLTPLLTDEPLILTPFTNREISYACSVHVTATGSVPDVFIPHSGMALEEYIGHEGALEAIAQAHQKTGSGFYRVLAAPYCCVKIPCRVLNEVGYLDETYGKGGGEDYDYSLRAHLLGFKTAFAFGSYVLHFGGKSSWSGVETREQQDERERVFFEYFRAKWGEKLFQYVLREKLEAVESTCELMKCADEAVIIRSLMSQQTFPLRLTC